MNLKDIIQLEIDNEDSETVCNAYTERCYSTSLALKQNYIRIFVAVSATSDGTLSFIYI